jgi:hypothetical protein
VASSISGVRKRIITGILLEILAQSSVPQKKHTRRGTEPYFSSSFERLEGDSTGGKNFLNPNLVGGSSSRRLRTMRRQRNLHFTL